MENHVEYMYVILLTPQGKNYGCFAFDKSNLQHGEVRIAASFCSSEDRKVFSKQEARDLADADLCKDESLFVLDPNVDMYELGDIDNEDLASIYFETNLDFKYDPAYPGEDKLLYCKSVSKNVPSWVAKCIKNKAFSFSLKYDNLSLQDLAKRLDLEYDTNIVYSLFVSLKNSVDQ